MGFKYNNFIQKFKSVRNYSKIIKLTKTEEITAKIFGIIFISQRVIKKIFRPFSTFTKSVLSYCVYPTFSLLHSYRIE